MLVVTTIPAFIFVVERQGDHHEEDKFLEREDVL